VEYYHVGGSGCGLGTGCFLWVADGLSSSATRGQRALIGPLAIADRRSDEVHIKAGILPKNGSVGVANAFFSAKARQRSLIGTR